MDNIFYLICIIPLSLVSIDVTLRTFSGPCRHITRYSCYTNGTVANKAGKLLSMTIVAAVFEANCDVAAGMHVVDKRSHRGIRGYWLCINKG